MATKFELEIKDLCGRSHHITYELDSNVVAHKWYDKIRHLHRLSLCPHYTYSMRQESRDQLNTRIRDSLHRLNVLIDLGYPQKHYYDQDDCNRLHAITLDTQYGHDPEVRDIFHLMHRAIHKLEHDLQGHAMRSLYAGWGEREGLLTTQFDQPPYDLYSRNAVGDIYLGWSEFGKTPFGYWQDHDADDSDHFIATCKPHVTFRALFHVSITQVPDQLPAEFETWFDRYRSIWQEKYNCGWTALNEWAGVPLAHAVDDFDWSGVDMVVSVRPL